MFFFNGKWTPAIWICSELFFSSQISMKRPETPRQTPRDDVIPFWWNLGSFQSWEFFRPNGLSSPPGNSWRFHCFTMDFWVVVSNMFYFHPYFPILTNIFQTSWNHQLDLVGGFQKAPCAKDSFPRLRGKLFWRGIWRRGVELVVSWTFPKVQIIDAVGKGKNRIVE